MYKGGFIMVNKITNWFYLLILVVISTITLFYGCKCGKEELSPEELKRRQREKEIEEAIKLAKKLKEEKPFDFENIQKRIIKNPGNVCRLEAEFIFIEMGENPDFYYDGSGACYADKWTNVYWRDFLNDFRKYKITKNGRNPSWNKNPKEAKVIYEKFYLNPRDWGGVNKGIEVSNIMGEIKPVLITDKPATHPYFVNDDKNIVYQLYGKYYILDENLNEKEITREEYERLVKNRYKIDCQWKTLTKYRGVEGIWITTPDERYFSLVFPAKNVKTVKIVPNVCWVYFWSPENEGILKFRAVGIPKFYVQLDKGKNLNVGDIVDVFQVRRSPINNKPIGYFKDKWKGSIQVIDKKDNNIICEYQTKIYHEVIEVDDYIVDMKTKEPLGRIVKIE